MSNDRRRFCEHCDAWFAMPEKGESNRHWLARADSKRAGRFNYVCRKHDKELRQKRPLSLRYYLTEMVRHAKQRGERFDRAVTVTVDDLERLWNEQGGCCAYSGFPLTHMRGKQNRPTNASLDRIDPAGGYTPDNVAIVQTRVNEMKWNNSLSSVLEIAEAIVARKETLLERYISDDDEESPVHDN